MTCYIITKLIFSVHLNKLRTVVSCLWVPDDQDHTDYIYRTLPLATIIDIKKA